MPQRVREKRVTGGPQGGDAWVTLKHFTVDEKREFQKWTMGIAVDANTDQKTLDDYEVEARKRLSGYIKDWNWVDDDGNPLPKPFNNPDVLGVLLDDELNFLMSAMSGQDEAAKKK